MYIYIIILNKHCGIVVCATTFILSCFDFMHIVLCGDNICRKPTVVMRTGWSPELNLYSVYRYEEVYMAIYLNEYL